MTTTTLSRTRAPARHIPATHDDATAAFERLRVVRAALAQRAGEREAAIAEVHADLDALCAPLVAENAQLEEAIRLYSEANRAALTKGKRKTIQFGGAGSVSWRKRPASIEVSDAEAALATLPDAGLAQCIRVKRSVDKEALLKAPAEQLDKVAGVRLVPGGEDCIVKVAE